MEELDCFVSISSLICEEDQTLLDDEEEGIADEHEMSVVLNDSDLLQSEEEYIEILISRESSFERRLPGVFHCEDSLVVNDSWLKWARSDAIQLIMKTGDYFGFTSQTAYLAVTYVDRFLMRQNIEKRKSWVVRLLSVACLSLAAKMEECMVPSLSGYTEECKFDCNTVQRMELLVLSTLDWRMSSVTPFAYLNYFTTKLQIENKSKELLSKSIRFIFAIIEDFNLMDHRPSTIAAAAILAASDQRLTIKSVGSKLSTFSLCGTLETEHVFFCYTMMIQKSQKKLVASDSLLSSELSVNCSSVDDSTSISTVRSKRRRLQMTQPL